MMHRDARRTDADMGGPTRSPTPVGRTIEMRMQLTIDPYAWWADALITEKTVSLPAVEAAETP